LLPVSPKKPRSETSNGSWRYFAAREFPLVYRDLGLPAAHPSDGWRYLRKRGRRCPLHPEHQVGKVTRMCAACHQAACDEVGRRFVEHRAKRPKQIQGRLEE
jgi:hypothetical protein